MTKIISIANQKGGVGKTTVTWNLGRCLTEMGCRVLMIDNDPQGNLSTCALEQIDEQSIRTEDLYLRKGSWGLGSFRPQRISSHWFIIPTDGDLVGAEYYLVGRSQRESTLKNILEAQTSNFDYVLIDNPPSLNLLTLNGLVASQYVLIPVLPEHLSLEGLAQIQSSIKDLQRFHPHIQVLGSFLNIFNNRRKLGSDVEALLKEELGDLVFNTKIHDSVKMAECTSFATPIMDYAPKSRSALEYMDLAHEVVARIKDFKG